jgi:hypothetical protein
VAGKVLKVLREQGVRSNDLSTFVSGNRWNDEQTVNAS